MLALPFLLACIALRLWESRFLCFMKLVSFLLRDHVKAMEERKLLHSFLAKSQKGLPPRTMKDSYIEVFLPLGSQPELREKYLTVQNTVR